MEIRYSLRSLAKHAPYIRKVWIFGDRPAFLSDDTTLIEHVPHEYVARVGDFRTPVTNFFLMLYLSSLIPDLDHEYLRFSDDYFLLRPYGIDEARKVRYLQDLSQVTNRGGGQWRDSLWRTYDLLKRLGYTGYNFETHTPSYLILISLISLSAKNGPVGLHSWRTSFKILISSFKILISELSRTAHLELFKLIDESPDFATYVKKLQQWADMRLVGGAKALPPGLQP